MENLEQKLCGLSITQRARPDDPAYLLHLSLQPCGVLAASCSRFRVHLYDRATLAALAECRGHTAPLCGLAFTRSSPAVLYSGSADGTVRGWDARQARCARVFRSEPSHSFCSVDLNCSDTLLCAGTERLDDSFLVFWDTRSAGPLGVYSESHSDDITQVRFHPQDKDRLASGSTDGLANVFDLKRGCEEEALLLTCNSGSSVAGVTWAGRAQLLCLCHDNGLHLWDVGQLDSEDPLTLYSTPDARGEGLDYLVGGAWLDDRLLVVGGTSSGDLHLMLCNGEGLHPLTWLRGGHTATVRCFLWDTEGQALVTAGEDAQLLLWKPGGGTLKSQSKTRLAELQ